MLIKIILENTEFSSNEINIELFEDVAPITVKNFIKLIEEKKYDGVIFHRVIKNFMIQTGGYYIENGSLKKTDETSTIKGEFKSNGVINNLNHTLGVISMARTQEKDSASSQFFLCAASCSHLDGEYAAFGIADEKGKQVIKEISEVKTGVLSASFTDFPYNPVTIKTIEIIER